MEKSTCFTLRWKKRRRESASKLPAALGLACSFQTETIRKTHHGLEGFCYSNSGRKKTKTDFLGRGREGKLKGRHKKGEQFWGKWRREVGKPQQRAKGREKYEERDVEVSYGFCLFLSEL